MINRKTYKHFSTDFFKDHQDILLYDVLHHIQAYFLYPLNCLCEEFCLCYSKREEIILSLNVKHYNQALERQENSERLHAMKLLLEIPEMDFFQKHYGKVYPLWLIEDNLQIQREILYESIGQLIWTFLRLAKTYEMSAYRESRASLKGALELLLGKNPLKAKGFIRAELLGNRCGEKAYSQRLNHYKSVCHFIAAIEFNGLDNFLDTADQIKEFLGIAEWIKEKLLSIQTPNIKGERLFLRENFLPIPSWIQVDKADISMEPFIHKLKEINEIAGVDLKK